MSHSENHRAGQPILHLSDGIFEALPTAIILYQPDNQAIWINQRAKDLLGMDAEITPRSVNDHFPFYLSPLITLLMQTDTDVMRGETKLELPSRETESTLGYNLRLVHETGKSTLKVLTFSDITRIQHDQLTLEKIKDELNQSRKLASIGTLIAGVAHEMNNPLTGISMSAGLLSRNLAQLDTLARKLNAAQTESTGPTPTLAELAKLEDGLRKSLLEVQKIISANHKASVLVNDLLSYSKPTQLSLAPMKISVIVKETCDALKSHPQFSGFSIFWDNDSPQWVLCDRVKIEQVFFNLFKNACEATNGAGLIRLSFSEDAPEQMNLQSKSVVTVHVQDNGPGIDTSIINRIFDPFFSTKGNNGIGLGLSMSYRTVEQHGGLLSVHNLREEGTEFLVTLPVHVLPEDEIAT